MTMPELTNINRRYPKIASLYVLLNFLLLSLLPLPNLALLPANLNDSSTASKASISVECTSGITRSTSWECQIEEEGPMAQGHLANETDGAWEEEADLDEAKKGEEEYGKRKKPERNEENLILAEPLKIFYSYKVSRLK
jgi:hypothetical protein